MSYDIHITRKNHWADDNDSVITGSEWKELADNDPEIEITGVAEAKTADGKTTIRMEKELLGQWKKSPDDAPIYFVYSDKEGGLLVSDPDKDAINKMKEIAIRLNAKVQGDDGEVY